MGKMGVRVREHRQEIKNLNINICSAVFCRGFSFEMSVS